MKFKLFALEKICFCTFLLLVYLTAHIKPNLSWRGSQNFADLHLIDWCCSLQNLFGKSRSSPAR
jgi:hypothetical protein